MRNFEMDRNELRYILVELNVIVYIKKNNLTNKKNKKFKYNNKFLTVLFIIH